MNILGKEFVAAINAILKEKNKKTISFDPIYFDGHPKKNELPWCNTFDCMIVTIGSPQMVIGKDSLENTKEFSYYEKKTIKAKGYPDCIWICGEDHGEIKYDFFNGTENEDWENLFFYVYDELRNKNDEDAEIWLEIFLIKYRGLQIKTITDKAKAILVDFVKERVLGEDNKILKMYTKTILMDKRTIYANSLSLNGDKVIINFQYADGNKLMNESCSLMDMSLTNIQNVIDSIETL